MFPLSDSVCQLNQFLAKDIRPEESVFNNSCHCFAYQHLTLFLKRRSLRSLVPSACSWLFLTSGVHTWRVTEASPLTVPSWMHGVWLTHTCPWRDGSYRIITGCSWTSLPQTSLSSTSMLVRDSQRNLTAQVSATEEQPSLMTLTLSKTLTFPALVHT